MLTFFMIRCDKIRQVVMRKDDIIVQRKREVRVKLLGIRHPFIDAAGIPPRAGSAYTMRFGEFGFEHFKCTVR